MIKFGFSKVQNVLVKGLHCNCFLKFKVALPRYVSLSVDWCDCLIAIQSSLLGPVPWNSYSTPASSQAESALPKEGVAVIERCTGRVIAGVAAPTQEELVYWLQDHPTFEVLRPSGLYVLVIVLYIILLYWKWLYFKTYLLHSSIVRHIFCLNWTVIL